MLTLRPYQVDAVASVFAYFVAKGGTIDASGAPVPANPVICLPTGTGKALVIAAIVKQAIEMAPRTRVLMLVRDRKLVQQNYEELLNLWPAAPVGIYCAGLRRKDTHNQIIYGTIDSVANSVELFGWRDLILIDECHMLSPVDGTRFQVVIAALQAINPWVRVIGLSATPFRLGLGYITENGIFTDICYNISGVAGFAQLLRDGHIAMLIPKRTKLTLDVSGVAINKGDYVASQLQAAVDKEEITRAALAETCELGEGRYSWLVFTTGVEHSEHCAEMLRSFGVPSLAIHSELSVKEQDSRFAAFKTGQVRAICGNNMFTTGFNHKPIDLIAVLRPTTSTALWVQLLGRGTRPFDGDKTFPPKFNCIAEGSLVLTDRGLVAIEVVKINDLVWDGICFVKHEGVCLRGKQEVISYAGLEATADHKVWTKKGWQTFGHCSEQQISIAITGNDGIPLRAIESYFTGNTTPDRQASVSNDRVPNLLVTRTKRRGQFAKWSRRVSQMWQCIGLAEMANEPRYCRETTLHKSERCTLSILRRTWNKIHVRYTFGLLSVGNRQYWFTKKYAFRSYRQQRPLSAGQFTLVNASSKYVEPPHNTKRVYDIINAGPRHRFTVNGLLVSNCLVLDYAANTKRLGPIDDPQIPRKRGKGNGDAPCCICEACGTYNHARAVICMCCGSEIEHQTKIVTISGTAALMQADLPEYEWFPVVYWSANKYSKHDAPDSVQVTYISGLRRFQQWLAIERTGFPGKIARDWWRRHSGQSDPPTTTDEALRLFPTLQPPRWIQVWLNKKYPEVVSSSWAEDEPK